MEIAVHPLGNAVVVQVKGRLDNTWAEFFSANLDRIVADGGHDLRLDLSDVNFLSSAGIGVLVRCYNQLRGIAGSFVVVRPSPRVSAVLQQTALYAVLCCGPQQGSDQGALCSAPQGVETDTASYEIYDLPSPAPLYCCVFGEPAQLSGAPSTPTSCYALGTHRFALGIGALGSHFDECRERFGEFISAEGGTAYQPSERASPPDYLVCADGSTAETQMLYGMTCDGGFRRLVRFETRKQTGPLPLAELVRRCLEFSDVPAIGMVMIAEVAGIVGAALRRSPALSTDPDISARVSDWLSFSPERSLQRTVALAAGLAALEAPPPLATLLRPIGAEAEPQGHFHAAAFSYQPLQRGVLQLRAAVKHLFDSQSLLAVLHLLNDTRPGIGIGQTELVRGACWIAEVADFRKVAA